MGTAKKATLEGAWEIITELAKAQQATDRQLKATDCQLKATDRQLKATDRRFNTQWGKLVESLVAGNIAQRFSQRGIQVQGTSRRVEKTIDGKQYEFDIIVHNGDEIIVIEVKTTLDVGDVKHFIEKLKCFKKAFPEYVDKKVYGAVAYIVADAGSDKYSENKKLFVIRATGDSASIVNAQGFKPRRF